MAVRQGLGSDFVLDWKAMGGGSYDVAVAKDGGLAQGWLSGLSGTTATFTGEAGHSYSFIVDYRDAMGQSATGISDAVVLGGALTS